MSQNHYTEYEINIIKEHYPIGGVKACQKYIKRSKDSIRHHAKDNGIKMPNGWRDKKDYYDLLNFNPINCYLLGLLWADGAIGFGKYKWNVSIGLIEEDFFQIKHLFDEKWKIYQRKSKKYPTSWKPFWVATHNSKILVTNLMEYDFNNKSSISPSKILNAIPENLRHYWWRGYFDGDGTVKGHVSISGSYDTDWEQAIKLCAFLKADYTISKRKYKHTKSSVFYFKANKGGRDSFLAYISQGESFGLKRKRELIKRPLKYTNSMYKGVGRFGNGKFLCRWQQNGKVQRKYFDTEIEAAKYYDLMTKNLPYHNKRKLNFP